MKKKIKAIVESFIEDFNQRKLEFLDKFLFALLLKKEIWLFEGKRGRKICEAEDVLSHYFNYRDLIYRRLAKEKKADKISLVRNIYPPPDRFVFLLTHNCQLRCKYCQVRKFPGSMKEEVLLSAIDLLFTSNSQELQFQFFGGEPLLRFNLIEKAVNYAKKINKQYKKDLVFIISTNGISLTREKIDFFKRHRFIVEYSIDDEVERQLKARTACDGKNYYSQMIHNSEYIRHLNIRHYSISVVMPNAVSSMFENFKHLVDIGFRNLQMNYSLGFFWPEKEIRTLFWQTEKILSYVKRRENIEFINLTSLRREPVVLNAELTVDCDGGVYSELGIFLEENFIKMKNKFLVTNLKKPANINFHSRTPFQNFYLLSKIYSSKNPKFRRIILNNILLGQGYGEFLKRY